MNEPAYEVNFDALVGPTHNYAGLAYGNLASQKWKGTTSNPKAAALEGLKKMKLLADLGLKQAVLPPQQRPDVLALRRLGFTGRDTQVLADAYRTDPILLAACSSASSMWAANAATVSPSADTADQRLHITPANLIAQFHRSLEASATAATLQAILPDDQFFAHHPPLPATSQLADEGAANHLRLAPSHRQKGLEIFVYGRSGFGASDEATKRRSDGGNSNSDPSSLRRSVAPSLFLPRHSCEASTAISRLHQLDPSATLFIQQNPAAIDHGVFHNDVISVGNENVLLYHQLAFAAGQAAIDEIRRRYSEVCHDELIAIRADAAELPLADAVNSYLFNSQLVTLPAGGMCLIAPTECLDCPPAKRFIGRILAEDNPIRSVQYVQVRQSMRNGGGPACLRLRIVLNESQLRAMRQTVLLTDALYANLVAWVNRHYRDALSPADLADPKLLEESRAALEELQRIL